MENTDLRVKAARLLAMANKFRQEGQAVYADMLTSKAAECLDQAHHSQDEKEK